MNDFDRLHNAGDIRAVFTSRTVAHGSAMAVHARPRGDDGPARATVVVGRTVGDAVRRNRVKRRLRAALHQVTPPRGLDVVVVGRSPALTADFTELTGQIGVLLARVSGSAAADFGDARPRQRASSRATPEARGLAGRAGRQA